MNRLNNTAVEKADQIAKDLPTLPTNFFDTISNSLNQINHETYQLHFNANLRRKL